MNNNEAKTKIDLMQHIIKYVWDYHFNNNFRVNEPYIEQLKYDSEYKYLF